MDIAVQELGFDKPSFTVRTGLADPSPPYLQTSSTFNGMLLSPVVFRREVSHCPRGYLLSTSPFSERDLMYSDTAHLLHPLLYHSIVMKRLLGVFPAKAKPTPESWIISIPVVVETEHVAAIVGSEVNCRV